MNESSINPSINQSINQQEQKSKSDWMKARPIKSLKPNNDFWKISFDFWEKV